MGQSDVTPNAFLQLFILRDTRGDTVEYILPLGVVGRTVEIRRKKEPTIANLTCLSELMQHQLSIAVLASGAGKEAFYAGLFHDIYKSAMNWQLRQSGWKWLHLPGEGSRQEIVTQATERFKIVLTPLDAVADVNKLAELCAGHHYDKRNPIRQVEPEREERGDIGAVSIETRVPLPEQLREIAYRVASFVIRSPYRAFVASLLIEKLLNRLNEAYVQLFREEFGLQELHMKYLFRQYEPFSEDPKIDYDDGILSVEVPVRAPPSLEGLVIEHHYLPTLDRPSLLVREKRVELKLRFSDALAFPIIGDENIMLWAITPAENLDVGLGLRAKFIAAFERAKEKALDDLFDISSIGSDLINSLRSVLLDELSEYKLPGAEEPKCMFCGAKASFRVTKRGLKMFVDIDRIVAFNNMACSPCKLAYAIEEVRRRKAGIPLCVVPLPATPIEAEALDIFKTSVVHGFSIPTHPLPPVKTALEEPWARIMSWAFYGAVLRDPDEFGLRGLKKTEEIEIPLFRFFLTRKTLIYPFLFRIRPAALISAWTTTGKKKFVLNVDTASEFVILPGAERDLTLEDLDVLAPLMYEGTSSLRKAYSIMRRLYELG
ncbi:MAG: hypothetical protein DRJ98_08460 [Thermoprotei archaeon]|nr:MAG: hypothetical protein DRJ98_08460 [Thermoprotei archaeon]